LPISRDQFKRGEDTKKYQLRKIFKENPEKAFSFEELAKRLNIPNNLKDRLDFTFTLAILQLSRFIEAKTIDKVHYYALKKRN